jgi:hypothetical protein
MKGNHIINLLDEQPLASISASDIEIIEAHTGYANEANGCAKCLRAYQAARASSQLLQERASLVIEPPPFFHTKVMAAIRERNQPPELLGFQKIWQSARTLVASLTILVALLTAVAFYTGNDLPSGISLGGSSDSADSAMFGPETLSEEEITYGQVMANLYDLDAEDTYEK